MPLKVLTFLGTRPEIIRSSRIMAAFDRHLDHKIVHTGQNYDYELNEIFFEELDVRRPDHFLGVDTSSLGKVLGGILIESEKILKQERPDAVYVLGDTNSAIAAVMARRMKIPVYHMEAGNRSFDQNVPEEVNRRLVDHIADFNLAYTEHARRHLLSEGLPHRRVYVVGSPMCEVLKYYRGKIEASDVLSEHGLTPGRFIIVSMHREENVDSTARLTSLIGTLDMLVERFGFPVVVSTHPRTRNRMDKLDGIKVNEQVRFLKPFGFYDYNKLQLTSFCAISDSGTIAEEASLLGFPAVTPRASIERPEGLDVGCVIMTGLHSEIIVKAVAVATAQFAELRERNERGPVPDDYVIDNTSQRVLNLLLGTARLSHGWDGLRLHDYDR